VLVRSANPAPTQPGGDRQLNHALHIIAITRASHDQATKHYLAPKAAEGKTTKAAWRCLKRALARRFHHLLAEPAQSPPTAKLRRRLPERTLERTIIGTAPSLMTCIS
jgi:hypothetical protein